MSRWSPRIVPFALIAGLAAQGPPVFVPKHGAMIALAAEDVPALLAHLPQTAAGRLLAEPEVAEAFATGRRRFGERHAGTRALIDAAIALGVAQTDPLVEQVIRQIDPQDVQRCELLAVRMGEEVRFPGTVFAIAPTPRAEGRGTRMFEDLAAQIGKVRGLKATADGRFGGLPAHVFEPQSDEDSDSRTTFVFAPEGTWLAHVPGLFVGGNGVPDACGAVERLPQRPAGVDVMLDLRGYLGLIGGALGGGMLPGFAESGVDRIARLRLRAAFAGDRILEELEATLDGEAQGLVGALLRGTAKLPAQPLPAGALAQLRIAVDVPSMLAALASPAMLGAELPEDVAKDVTAAVDGGLAFGAAAPAAGGVIPRMFLSVGIADAAAADRLIDRLVQAAGCERKTMSYEGTECTVLKLEALPAALQPTFCRRDGVLHVAESGLSMRALLKALAAGGEAMDVGDAPVPAGPGEPLPTFDLRSDAAAMYRAFVEVWLPLYALTPMARRPGAEPLLRRDEMPAPEVVARHVAGSRGVLRKTADGYLLQQVGALGGVDLAALAMTWGPILSGPFHQDGSGDNLRDAIARHRLEAAFTVLEAWRTQKGALPASLGEVFAAGKLPDDALLVPGDAMAEEVPVPGTDRKVRSSFRYFPKGVKVDGNAVILIAIAPRPYRRPMLADDGSLPDVWGDESSQAIGEFGK